VATQFGLDPLSILAFNKIQSPRLIRPGRTLRIPDQDGIMVPLDEPTSVQELANRYGVFRDRILAANRLPISQWTVQGDVFVPGGHYSSEERRELLGEEFLWPTIGGRISSFFGRRNDPFTGARSYHAGLDIANYYGAPVLAAQDGIVVSTTFDAILGNHIVIDQGQGYISIYGHLSAFLTKPGNRVKAGQRIGRVGSTGYSTGPHLHFAAYRWKRLLNPMSLFG